MRLKAPRSKLLRGSVQKFMLLDISLNYGQDLLQQVSSQKRIRMLSSEANFNSLMLRVKCACFTVGLRVSLFGMGIFMFCENAPF